MAIRTHTIPIYVNLPITGWNLFLIPWIWAVPITCFTSRMQLLWDFWDQDSRCLEPQPPFPWDTALRPPWEASPVNWEMRTTGNRSVVPAILAEAHVSEVILDHSAPVKPESDSLQVNVESWRELGAAQLSPNQTPNSQPWAHGDCFRTAVSGNWTWEEGWGLVLTSRIVFLLLSRAVVSDSLWPHGQHQASLSFTISRSLL